MIETGIRVSNTLQKQSRMCSRTAKSLLKRGNFFVADRKASTIGRRWIEHSLSSRNTRLINVPLRSWQLRLSARQFTSLSFYETPPSTFRLSVKKKKKKLDISSPSFRPFKTRYQSNSVAKLWPKGHRSATCTRDDFIRDVLYTPGERIRSLRARTSLLRAPSIEEYFELLHVYPILRVLSRQGRDRTVSKR